MHLWFCGQKLRNKSEPRNQFENFSLDRCVVLSTLVNKKQAIEHMLSTSMIFRESSLFLVVEIVMRSIYPSAICWSVQTRRQKSIFCSTKKALCQKSLSNSRNVYIHYLHLVARRERTSDLHSKALGDWKSWFHAKNLNFSKLSFKSLSRKFRAHA